MPESLKWTLPKAASRFTRLGGFRSWLSRRLEDYRKFRLSSRPVPVPQNLAAWSLLGRSLISTTGEHKIMSGTITLQSSPGLSEILGAYDTGHWETVTAQIKPATGVLLRGSVLSAVTADGGKLTLTVGGQEATRLRHLLDASVDTTAAYGKGTVTGSVARAGSFRGAALIVGAGTDEAALAKQLRLLGIFTEGAIAPVALAAKGERNAKSDRARALETYRERIGLLVAPFRPLGAAGCAVVRMSKGATGMLGTT